LDLRQTKLQQDGEIYKTESLLVLASPVFRTITAQNKMGGICSTRGRNENTSSTVTWRGKKNHLYAQ
jgi:hypothetical protein